ncbi:MAG: Tim44-like domain-containing protein [Pseudomonadota bacterium]
MTMKKFLASMMIAVTSMAMIAEVTAKPLGGGRSIGRQSQNVTRQQAAPAPTQAQRQAPAPAAAGAPAAVPKPSMPWKGILGGALLGLGLGALLSNLGIGAGLASAISSILMIALLAGAVYFIYRMFRRKTAAPATSGFQPSAAGRTPEIGSGMLQKSSYQPVQQPAAGGYGQAANAQWGVPSDFDADAFLRQAKLSFIRMQAAWDKADVNDLREFTTPEVFAELKMQIQERGASADFTDVVKIDAELLGIETISDEYVASVKFSGLIKSAPDAQPEPLAEVWNMSKPVNGSTGWVLAGIQQLS